MAMASQTYNQGRLRCSGYYLRHNPRRFAWSDLTRQISMPHRSLGRQLQSIEMQLKWMYIQLYRPATRPKMEDMLMILPLSSLPVACCKSICLITCLLVKKTDLALTAIVVSQTSSGVSWILRPLCLASMEIPALLTRLVMAVSQ